MKDKNLLFFLEDIKNSLEKIFKYTDNINFDQFISNEMIKDAVERNFEIIGEAVKNLPEDLRKQNPQIPFRQVASMRDKLIHDYFGVDYEIIWKTIKDKLPQFKKDIENLISDYK